MEKTITITYNIIEDTIDVNMDMTVFEALAMLEAAKVLVGKRWIKHLDEQEKQ